MTTLNPVGHRVLVLPDKVEETTESGIVVHIDEKSKKLAQSSGVKGTLVAVGPNAWKAFDDGEPWANIGDRVAFAKYAGKELDIDGEEYLVMNDEDILATITGEKE